MFSIAVADMLSFQDVASRFSSPSESTVELRRCPDQYIGLVSEIQERGEFTCRIPTQDRPFAVNCVLLILESPHTSEYDTYPGPAKGVTGQKIVRYLRQVKGLSDTAQFGLVLINAIQFQCSLGRPTKEVRDFVFRDAWDAGGKVDFETRLRSIYRTGDCVVNSCTRGASSKIAVQLRVLVQSSLETTLPHGTAILRRNHPSFWHVPSNRNREWSKRG